MKLKQGGDAEDSSEAARTEEQTPDARPEMPDERLGNESDVFYPPRAC